MATSMRKRGATFLLEKPLVSRLPFEVEQPFSTSTFPRPKRVKPTTSSPSPSWRPATDAQSETSEMQEVYQREEVAAADVEVEVDGEKGCWLAEARDNRGVEHEEELQAQAPTGAAAGNSGELGVIVVTENMGDIGTVYGVEEGKKVKHKRD